MTLLGADLGETNAVSQRHLVSRAATIGMVMRHTANLLVSIVVLCDPASGARLTGRLLIGALGAWAIYRLVTRRHSAVVVGVDVAFTVGVCLGIPLLVDDPGFFLSNCAPVAVAGTAVIGFTVGLRIWVSFMCAVLIAASYAIGAAAVIGWPRVPEVFNLYYFGLQWGTCVLIRLAELRVASAVDTARARRHDADLSQRVAEAVREYDREQLRLLHDTVASTLLLVGSGSPVPPDRLARQAERDLCVLGDPQMASLHDLEVVGALRDLTPHFTTPMRLIGLDSLWVDGDTGQCLVSVVREALNNVDRHARARTVTVDVGSGCIAVADDGAGFDPATSRRGYGISHSMGARMQTLGGSVDIASTIGEGTTTTLTWPKDTDAEPVSVNMVDPDRLIERTRTGYGFALTVYAVLSLAAMAPASVSGGSHPGAQVALATGASVLTLVALPYTLRKRASPAIFPAALLIVALLQTALLPPAVLGGQAQWSQATIGWCMLPFLLRKSTRGAAAWLAGGWVLVAAFTFIRAPSVHIAVNLGLGTASILAVQLFALLFSGLISDAAADAHAELTELTALVARKQIASAVQVEYRRRYARLCDNVRPLLEAWRERTPVDPSMRRRAKAESQRLRVLFTQSATFDHPLLARLRAAIDAAEARGVDISVDVQGVLPPVSERDADQVTAPLVGVLTRATSIARLTVLVLDVTLVASVVCRDMSDADLVAVGATFGDDVDVFCGDGTVWLTVRHRLRRGRPPDDDDFTVPTAVDLHHR